MHSLGGGYPEKTTRPELAVRYSLPALEFCEHLHPALLSGKPGRVLPSSKAVIFLHWGFNTGVLLSLILAGQGIKMVGTVGIEPTTPAMSMQCSPAELRALTEVCRPKMGAAGAFIAHQCGRAKDQLH